MKKALIATAIVIIPLAIILLGKETQWYSDRIAIHIHDTYFILPYWLFAIFIVSLLTLVFSATAACCYRLKMKGYNLLVLMGLLGMVGSWCYYKMVF